MIPRMMMGLGTSATCISAAIASQEARMDWSQVGTFAGIVVMLTGAGNAWMRSQTRASIADSEKRIIEKIEREFTRSAEVNLRFADVNRRLEEMRQNQRNDDG